MLLGIPQGLVLGPILFLLYTAELFYVIAECGLKGHTPTTRRDAGLGLHQHTSN